MGKRNRTFQLKHKKYSKHREIIDKLKIMGVYEIFDPYTNKRYTLNELMEKEKKAKELLKQKFA